MKAGCGPRKLQSEGASIASRGFQRKAIDPLPIRRIKDSSLGKPMASAVVARTAFAGFGARPGAMGRVSPVSENLPLSRHLSAQKSAPRPALAGHSR
jgi:hypothetical protein